MLVMFSRDHPVTGKENGRFLLVKLVSERLAVVRYTYLLACTELVKHYRSKVNET